jgi:hypothetical protein
MPLLHRAEIDSEIWVSAVEKKQSPTAISQKNQRFHNAQAGAWRIKSLFKKTAKTR